jgi:hypothetical protein
MHINLRAIRIAALQDLLIQVLLEIVVVVVVVVVVQKEALLAPDLHQADLLQRAVVVLLLIKDHLVPQVRVDQRAVLVVPAAEVEGLLEVFEEVIKYSLIFKD